VIDYKTGEAKVAAWLGDRPDEPQLPMYALGRQGARRRGRHSRA
jgi:hypothetical protein